MDKEGKKHRINICFPFVGDSIGGSHISAITLIKNLNKKKYNVIIVIHKEYKLTKYLKDNNLNYKLLPLPALVGKNHNILGHALDIIKSCVVLKCFLKEHDIKIVHSNDMQMHLTWALPAKLAKIPHIWHQRTKFPDSRLCRYLACLPKTIICISNFVKNSLPKHLQGKAKIIYNPIVINKIDEDKVKQYRSKISNDKKDVVIVASFGNLRQVKQPMLFMQLAGSLNKNVAHKMIFAVFGEDREGYIEKMQQYADEHGFADKFIFMGFKYNISLWMNACDYIIATSNADGLGRSLIEAMQVKKPVFATNAGGHNEIIQHGYNGFLFDSDNIEDFIADFKRVMNNTKLKEKIINNAYESSLNFLPDKITGKVEAVYYDSAKIDCVMVIADLHGGGAQKVFSSLANFLSKQGINIKVITFADSKDDKYKLNEGIIRITLNLQNNSSNIFSAVSNNLQRIIKLRKIIKTSNAPNIISFLSSTNVIVILSALGLNRKIIISERNDPERQNLGHIWNFLRNYIYKYANVITANSRNACSSLEKLTKKNKPIYIPNQLVLPKSLDYTKKEKIILAVGRLHKQKAYDILIPSFALTGLANQGWQLVILGDGALKDELIQLGQQHGLNDSHVSFIGYTKATEKWYRKALIYVLPSRHEGMPNALLEAASFLCAPIISDACQGVQDVFLDKESCLYTKVEDRQDLAAKMCILAKDSNYTKTIAEKARNVVVKEFDANIINQKWLSLLFCN